MQLITNYVYCYKGIYSPTLGTALINGLDITKHMDKIRKSLGFVPQYNVLFDEMSVEDHLWFYARLKGLDVEKTKAEIEKLLADTGLMSKRNELSKNLSGGMQRKLSVAIAFVGGSKTVILDEPSAGVDPKGRRSIWDLLFKYRNNRTIVITTHHMDEADILGDRIAIIANGKLITHASSFYLKGKFARGYYLTIAQKRSFNSSEELLDERKKEKHHLLNGKLISSCDNKITDDIESELRVLEENLIKTAPVDSAIDSFIKLRIQNAILIKCNPCEMVYSISNKIEYTKEYGKIFKELEDNFDSLRIDSIGISDTKLEEIFVRLAGQAKNIENIKQTGVSLNFFKKKCSSSEEEVCEDEVKNEDDVQLEKYSEYAKERVNNKLILLIQQLRGLIIKRFHRVRRNIKGIFVEIILPIIFVALALLFSSLRPKIQNLPALEIHPWFYETPNYIFYKEYDNNTNTINLNSIKNLTSTFFESPSIGTRCMKNHTIEVVKYHDYGRISKSIKKLYCNNKTYSIAFNKKMPLDLNKALEDVNYENTKISPDCTCPNGYPVCPLGAGGDVEYKRVSKLQTKDILIDLTERNVSDWLIKTELNKKYFRKRYGGFDFSANTNDSQNSMDQLVRAYKNLIYNESIENTPVKTKVKIWYNNDGWFAHIAFLNVLNNAILRSKIKKLNANLSLTEIGIVPIYHPLSYNKQQYSNTISKAVMNDVFVGICVVFALSLIPASFSFFIVEERSSNAKQLQFVSGIKPYIYWLSNYMWDFFNYLLPCFLCIIVFIMFDIKSYTSKENFPFLICLLIMYGWASKFYLMVK